MYLIFTFREFKSIHKGKTAILHLRFGTEKNRRLDSKKARYNRAFRRRHLFCLLIMVGVTGFEPAASWSRTKRSTKLSHTPFFHALELYHICGGLSIFFLQLLSFFCFPDCGDERCRFASRRRGRVRASCIGKCQMLFVFPIGRQARSLFHATVRLKILHRFANISFSK